MAEDDVKEESEIQSAAKEMRDHLWTDSLWQTYQESLEVIVPDPANPNGPGHRITRKISMGMSVKSDNRAPAKILQYALSRSLNVLMEEEKEKWLDAKSMEMEIERSKWRLNNDNSSGSSTPTTGVAGEGVHTDPQAGAEGANPDNTKSG